MTQQIINLGATGSGAGGDSARTAFEKAIANFAELYIAALPGTAAQKQAARDVLGLGTAATKAAQTGPTDPTPGALMAVGAGGLLGSAETLTLDEAALKARLGGFYYSVASDVFPLAGPLLVSRNNSRGFALHARSSRVTVVTYSPIDGEATQVLPLYHQRNILGTVSQSGGVPTGAIIERGSNANGEYVRFADGAQICVGQVTCSYTVAAFLAATWTFPAVFSGNANVFPVSPANTEVSGKGNRATNCANPGTVSSAIRKFATGSDVFVSGETSAVHVLAIGRWY